jgi:hypothetical protein
MCSCATKIGAKTRKFQNIPQDNLRAEHKNRMPYLSNLTHHFLKIVFDNRKDSGSLDYCLISVDGTDVRIPQQGSAIPGNPFS